MSIKEAVARIREKLGSEVSEEINSILAGMVRTEEDLIADRTDANGQAKERKLKLREMETTIDTMKAENTELKTKIEGFEKEKTELGEYKTKWVSQEQQRNEANKTEWDGIKKRFDVKETDKGFDQINKIKKYYTFADNLTSEQISRNLEIAKQHEELGLFSVDPTATPPANTPKGSEPAAGLTEIKPW